jgi:glutaredoxin|tara:strand:- start:304 stop:564 length:261 start_codon:yes stop_codon:yes gene_type:complete
MKEQESYQLFKTDLCGFCYRVRDFAEEKGISLTLRDTMTDMEAFRELLQGGGRSTVPCLKIQREKEVIWMYESLDIIDYLNEQAIP